MLSEFAIVSHRKFRYGDEGASDNSSDILVNKPQTEKRTWTQMEREAANENRKADGPPTKKRTVGPSTSRELLSETSPSEGNQT